MLRFDPRHRGMLASVLRDGLIPPDWRRFAWSEQFWASTEIIVEFNRWAAGQNQTMSINKP